jgi:hypothetical protein
MRELIQMGKGKRRTMKQRMQSIQAESAAAANNLTIDQFSNHKEAHEPNRPSTGFS